MSANPFAQFWTLGYRNLIPITPPDAQVDGNSTLTKKALGKSPGMRGADGLWHGFNWLHEQANEVKLERWAEMGAGVGIRTGGGLAAIDADTLSPEYAEIIERAVLDNFFTHLPKRIGRAPKALYPIRISEPMKYARIDFGGDAENGIAPERVEILGAGRQFVANGIHPVTTEPYRWERPLVPFDELPSATPAQVLLFLDDLRSRLPAASALLMQGGDAPKNQAALKGDLDMVRRADRHSRSVGLS